MTTNAKIGISSVGMGGLRFSSGITWANVQMISG
jgi:hypothetical protein